MRHNALQGYGYRVTGRAHFDSLFTTRCVRLMIAACGTVPLINLASGYRLRHTACRTPCYPLAVRFSLSLWFPVSTSIRSRSGPLLRLQRGVLPHTSKAGATHRLRCTLFAPAAFAWTQLKSGHISTPPKSGCAGYLATPAHSCPALLHLPLQDRTGLPSD